MTAMQRKSLLSEWVTTFFFLLSTVWEGAGHRYPTAFWDFLLSQLHTLTHTHPHIGSSGGGGCTEVKESAQTKRCKACWRCVRKDLWGMDLRFKTELLGRGPRGGRHGPAHVSSDKKQYGPVTHVHIHTLYTRECSTDFSSPTNL